MNRRSMRRIAVRPINGCDASFPRMAVIASLTAVLLTTAARGQDLVPAPADLKLRTEYDPPPVPTPSPGDAFGPPTPASEPREAVDFTKPHFLYVPPKPSTEQATLAGPVTPHDLEIGRRHAKTDKLVLQAKACYESGSVDRGLEVLDAALRDDSDNVSARLWRAYLLMGRAKYKSAIDDLDCALVQCPAFPDALAMRARCRTELAWAGEASYVEPALRDAERALELGPGNPSALTVRGAVAIIQQKYDRAIADLTQVIDRQPRDTTGARRHALYYRAIALMQKGDDKAPINDLNSAIAEESNNTTARLMRAVLLAKQARFKQAVDDLDSVLALFPTCIEALQGRAYCRMELAWAGDRSYVEPALHDAERVLASEPNDSKARAVRGAIAIIQGEYDRAIADLTDALNVQPNKKNEDHPGVLSLRAIALMEQGRYEQALDDLNLAIEQRPDNPRLFGSRAWAFCAMHDLDRALSDYDQVVRLAPKDNETILDRAYVRWWKGDDAGAKADMDRIGQLKSQSADAYSLHAYLALFLLHERNRALASLERAIDLEPREALYYAVRSWLRAQNNEFVAAFTDVTLFIRTQHLSEVKLSYGIDTKRAPILVRNRVRAQGRRDEIKVWNGYVYDRKQSFQVEHAGWQPAEYRRKTGRLMCADRSIPQHCGDPLVEVEHAGLVEEHLAPLRDDFFDHIVNRVIERRGPFAGIRQQAIALRAKVCRMDEARLDQQNLAALFVSGPPHLVDSRGMAVDTHRFL